MDEVASNQAVVGNSVVSTKNYWVRRLFTREDAVYLHSHKIIGTLCLLHFAYRIVLHVRTGSMYLVTGSYLDLVFILLHTLLQVTAFQFRLPTRRNSSTNVIWPEMRLHTTIFALRSIITWFITWLNVQNFVYRPIIVFATMMSADLVTYMHKADKTTMRDNPMPLWVNPKMKRFINYLYSTAQVFATLQIMNTKANADMTFCILLSIQVAPFLMTLVKKNFISRTSWHVGYALCLVYAYHVATSYVDNRVSNEVSNGVSNGQYFPGWFLKYPALAFCFARFSLNINKYVLWTIITCLASIAFI